MRNFCAGHEGSLVSCQRRDREPLSEKYLTHVHVESWCPLQPPLPEYRCSVNAVGWRLGRELLPPHRASPSSRHRRRRMRPLDNISKALMGAPSDLKAGSGGSATVTDRYTRHVRTHSERPPSAPRAVPISRSNPTRPNAVLRQRRRECVQRRLARREDDPSRLASERTEAARTLPSEYVVVDPDHVERDLIASGTHSAASFRRSGTFASSRRQRSMP
jgi:hypothetical protein